MKRVVAFGENLKKYRKKEGLTQRELAEKLGYTEKSVSKWESMQSIPDLDKILLLAQVFAVSTDYLLKEECASACLYKEYRNRGKYDSPCRSSIDCSVLYYTK